jgi:hypothetical protein
MHTYKEKRKNKAILVSCETSKNSHFLDDGFIDGGEIVSLKRRPPFTTHEDSWYSFLLEAESTPKP